jgi:hypothetical protein
MAQETDKNLERKPKAELDEGELDEVSGGHGPSPALHAQDEDPDIGGRGIDPLTGPGPGAK